MQQRHADTVINAVKVAVMDTDTALYLLPIKLQLLLAICLANEFNLLRQSDK